MFVEINIPPVLNPSSIHKLLSELGNAEQADTRFIVLKGSSTVFCDGLDLAWVANGDGMDHLVDMQAYALFLKKLQTGKFISIASVKGSVSGGGMGIVCGCDHVIADPQSTFALPEGLLGLIPGMILPSLLNRMTPQHIKKMVYTGKKYPAAAALAFGIADEITDDGNKAVKDAINALRSCKPGAVSDIKEILYRYSAGPDKLSEMGMHLLDERLKDPEIRQRLKDISDFI